MDFVKRYGVIEQVYRTEGEDKATGRASRETCSIREKPGISPALIADHILPFSTFIRLSDIAEALPPYKEVLEFVDLDPELEAVHRCFHTYVAEAMKKAVRAKDMKVISQANHALLSWVDQPQQAQVIVNRYGDIVAEAPAMDIRATNKDLRLVECVREAKRKGRMVLIFAEYTGKKGAGYHLETILRNAGLNPLHLRPEISTEQRLGWIRNKLKTGNYDCMISNPKLVETGLNLREFPEICFWQTGFSTYILRQASRRSWRPGQLKEVIVRFFINRGTLQESAMSLIATKLQAAMMLEGELADDGLIAMAEAGDDMNLLLARALIGELKLGGLEQIFAGYRKAEESILGFPGGSLYCPPKLRVDPMARSESSLIRGCLTSSGQYITGQVRQNGKTKYTLSLIPTSDGSYLIQVNGLNSGSWSGDYNDPITVNKRKLMLQPDSTALPGMAVYAVYEKTNILQ